MEGCISGATDLLSAKRAMNWKDWRKYQDIVLFFFLHFNFRARRLRETGSMGSIMGGKVETQHFL
jgi:hypothetical protein